MRELRQSLMQLMIEYNEQQIAVTATLGVAQLDNLQLELIRWQSAADIALYQGKKTGRNKVGMYRGRCGSKQLTDLNNRIKTAQFNPI